LTEPDEAQGCLDPDALLHDTNDLTPSQLIPVLKASLAMADERLAEKFYNKEDVNALVKARAWVVEQLILATWDKMIPADEGVALIAVGGFGRGELHPHSDVDLLILLPSESPTGRARKAIEEFVMLLWDTGFYLGHSVRSIDACVSEARKNIATATSMMESRLLSGPKVLFEEMLEATAADHVWSAADFFYAKYEEQLQRHQQYHDTAYNLEPNIKEGPGGLRDIQMIGWVAKRYFSTQSLHALVEHGFLAESELQELRDGRTFLWEIRFALHLLAGRGEDRFLFEYQRQIAAHFSDLNSPDESNVVVEQFMQRYYRIVMRLERLNESLLQLFKEELLPVESARTEDLGNGFQMSRGYLEVPDRNLFKLRPVALIELFVVLAKHDQLLGVRASTIRLIRDNLYLIDDEFRAEPGGYEFLYELLCQPSGVYSQLQRMNRYGVLAALIPAFGNIVGRMQFDLFHVYTVDQHILFMIRNLRRFAYGKYKAEFAHAAEIFLQIENPELLYLAALFHDIAKGRDGDHSVLGAQDALEFCQRLPISESQCQLVAWLVEQHLTMSQTAQRRDITDPETIRTFCKVVENQQRLEYLYLTTIADIAATSPKLWNNWKDSLLWELYKTTSAALSDGRMNELNAATMIESTRQQVRRNMLRNGADGAALDSLWSGLPENTFQRFSAKQLQWASSVVLDSVPATDAANLPLVAIREVKKQGVSELLVHAADYDGLFAAVTAVIDEIGLDVLSARVITTSSGNSFDLFQLMDRHAMALNENDSRRLRARLLEVMGESTVPSPVVRKLPRRLRHFNSRMRIRFSGSGGSEMTLMDLECADRPGLLSQVSAVMVSCGIRIHDAKIATMGDRVEDAFIISDQHNAALSTEMRTELKQALKQTLEPS